MKKYKNSEGKLNSKSTILQWWRNKTLLEQKDLCEIYKEIVFENRNPGTLTSREIQNIYEKEHS